MDGGTHRLDGVARLGEERARCVEMPRRHGSRTNEGGDV